MTVREMINTLEAERRQLDDALATLQRLEAAQQATTAGKPAKGRRGRKFMGQAERAQVSERMRTYWAGRRKARTA